MRSEGVNTCYERCVLEDRPNLSSPSWNAVRKIALRLAILKCADFMFGKGFNAFPKHPALGCLSMSASAAALYLGRKQFKEMHDEFSKLSPITKATVVMNAVLTGIVVPEAANHFGHFFSTKEHLLLPFVVFVLLTETIPLCEVYDKEIEKTVMTSVKWIAPPKVYRTLKTLHYVGSLWSLIAYINSINKINPGQYKKALKQFSRENQNQFY